MRRQLGVVLQTSRIINGSIKDNVMAGRFYTDDQVIQALYLAGFEADLKLLPDGIYTSLINGGTILSGGQKQRICIARALIGQPKIVIFDEATSALDNCMQEKISYNLDQLCPTRLVIAHRLSTIKNADRIYVLNQGEIVESGTFETLTKQEGLFAQLARQQNLI